jgi:4-hydroxy-tetrahydrodipicolinate synthase
MGNSVQNKLIGTGVALITPFTAGNQVDELALKNHVEMLILNGVNYLVALGTTSESATLTSFERRKVIDIILEQSKGRIPIVVGIGGNNTQEAIENISSFDFSGIDAVLSVVPYYTRPQQEGLYQHFKAISEASPIPIILYNVPSRSAVNLEADTTLRLAHDCKNIIAIKEASGVMNQIMKIILHKPKDFLVISGDDAITLPLIAAGADGVISVVANAFPSLFSQMVSKSLQGDFEVARKLHYQLLDFIQTCFVDGSPAGVKAFMAAQGRIQNVLRLPLVSVNNKLNSAIIKMVQESK